MNGECKDVDVVSDLHKICSPKLIHMKSDSSISHTLSASHRSALPLSRVAVPKSRSLVLFCLGAGGVASCRGVSA